MLPLDLVAGIIGNIILQGEPLIKRDVKVKEMLFEGFDVTKYTNSLLRGQLPKEFSGGRFGLYKGVRFKSYFKRINIIIFNLSYKFVSVF